jgi:2-dehydro-3-deoxygluconokinase
LLTGLDEINMITGSNSESELASLARRYSIGQLVIKDGANGSKVYSNGKWYRKNAFKVKAIDTVGAGDGFDAGYVYGYLHGLSLDERLELGNSVGALVTTVSGDNEGLPYLEEVSAFMQKEAIIER